jgi:O-acetyl-ADP-ribose deacetylase (regulator of RNase III)
MIHTNENILHSDYQYIAHQCNCVSKNSAGLAKSIFEKYPYSNIYQNREKNDSPGNIIISGNGDDQRYIINMLSQFYPGTPKYETYEQRLGWFKSCILKISEIKNIKEIAFPFNIGCGLAGGKWEDYENLISFLDNYCEVFICKIQ